MINWHLDNAIAWLTLDRGSARNAISIAGWERLAQIADEIGDSGARAVIVRSAMPGSFSAGADLAEFRALIADAALRTRFRTAMLAGIEGVAALPIPVLAAVDGGCFGAAVALTLACDIVVAGDAAIFATTPARLGIGYPASDVARLAARVGQGQAARMLFTGSRVNGAEAVRIGLVHHLARHAEPAALAMAEDIAANDGDAVRMLKRVLRDPAASAHAQAFEDMFGSPAFAGRLDAFLGGKR